MTVSIIIPVRNGAAYISEAIQSAFAQGADLTELIVVDDGSTDDTRAVVASQAGPGLRMIASDGSGVSAARNAGARAARGDWLLFLDSDDRLRPHAIRTLIEAAAGQPGVLLSYGDYRRIDERGAPIGSRRWLGFRRKPTGDVLRQLLTGNFIVTGAAVVQARAFRDLGGFSERLRYAEDWHLWCRLAAHGAFASRSGSHILDYRLHRMSTMHPRVLELADLAPAIQAVFADRDIASRFSADELLKLEARCRSSMLTYIATEALRSNAYRAAMQAVSEALQVAPHRSPTVLSRIAGTLVGL